MATDQQPASSSVPAESDVKQQPIQPLPPPIQDSETKQPSETPQKQAPAPIVYDLPPANTAETALNSLVETTKSKFAQRAARFGSDARPVRDVDVLGARRASVRQGFATGFDIHSEEQKRRRALRAKRFGSTQPSQEDTKQTAPQPSIQNLPVKSDPLERRRDVAVGELPRDNVLHVFGVDDMSTRDILSHFRPYGPSWCEWLNDSSVNVAFEDAFTLKRVLTRPATAKVSTDAPEDRMEDSEGAGTSIAVAGEGSLAEELQWRPTEPFTRGEVVFPLWVRQATEKDRRPDMPNPRSKWSRTVREKKRADRVGRDSEYKNMSDEGRTSRRRQLGVRSTIRKARAKKVTKMDLDKALETQ